MALFSDFENVKMYLALGILCLTVILFVFEIIRVDLVGILVMVIIGVTGLVPADELFSGFSSNAVISIIAVMIIGRSLDKTGIMHKVAGFIAKFGGKSESRIMITIASTVALISSFMQNVGAAALFLPVASRVGERANVPLSRILIPMGFCAILGGTLTMAGSSPLIMLSDLVINTNKTLPEGVPPIEPFAFFDVFPVGLALIISGLLYFLFFGKYLLPKTKGAFAKTAAGYFKKVYGMGEFFEIRVTSKSPLMGKLLDDVYSLPEAERPWIVAFHDKKHRARMAPSRKLTIGEAARFAVMGTEEEVKKFVKKFKMELRPELEVFADSLSPNQSGVREILVTPNSDFIGKSFSEIGLPGNTHFSILRFYRGETQIDKLKAASTPLEAGDILLMHASWDDFSVVNEKTDLVVIGTIRYEKIKPQKIPAALICFSIALGMLLFTDFKVSLSLMVGALGMILTGVINIDSAYRAVDWKTIFLLAGLLPLGLAVQQTGAALWIANGLVEFMQSFGDVPVLGYEILLAVLTTIFTLVMSNVGATVLLVPLAVSIAIQVGGDPRIFIIIVGLSASNAFLIPTHQVSALIMGPGDYKVIDFIKAGSVMSIIFLVVMLTMVHWVF